MCGIAGGAGFSAGFPVNASVLGSMLETLVHRGPDDEGQHIEDHVALGARRLAIIDVAGGHQPVANGDGSVWVALNGEIFNFPSLRAQLGDRGHRFSSHSDTEVIAHAYEEWGDACVERLNGQFAFALWDRARERLLLARDRAGIKPLHYRTAEGSLVFASEIKAMLACRWVPRHLDPEALSQYLTFEHVPVPRTIFRDIQKLPPGHLLVFDRQGASLRPYWDWDLAQSEMEPISSGAVWEERFRTALWDAVEMELISDVPLGVFLSGGIDSSAIAAIMAQRRGRRVQSFSIAFDDPSFDESQHARLVADHLGLDHHEQILSQSMMFDLVPRIAEVLDEPMGDSSIIPCYLLAGFARRHVTVALGGDGGDELLAGYSTLQAHRLAAYYNRTPGLVRDRLVAPLVARLPVSHNNLSLDFKAKRFVTGAALDPVERHHRWLGSFGPEEKAALLAPDLRDQIDPDSFAAARAHFDRCRAEDDLNRMLYTDFKVYLDTDILTKVDRSTMAHSVEARVPFLNHAVLEVTARMPLAMKLNRMTRKHVLRRVFKDILPDRILNRPKKGFNIPVARWFRNELKPLLLDTLSPAKLQREGLFRPDAVQALLDDHFAGRRDNRKHLWTLLVFELWHDRWFAPAATPAAVVQR